MFFHGASGRGEQGLGFLQDVAAERELLVLLPTSAASTWDLIVGGLGPDVRGLDAALSIVFAEHVVNRIAFAGFSDGASYALSLGLANGDVSGIVLAFSPGFAAPPDHVGRPREGGYDVHYEEFDGGHVVPPGLVSDAVAFWLQ